MTSDDFIARIKQMKNESDDLSFVAWRSGMREMLKQIEKDIVLLEENYHGTESYFTAYRNACFDIRGLVKKYKEELGK